MEKKTGYNSYKMFGCFNRKFKMTEKDPPADVRVFFTKYTNGGTQMTADQFLRFLVEVQCENGYTVADAEKIIADVAHRREHSDKYASRGLSLGDFYYYLFQDDLNGPIISQVHDDMKAPLHQYFIYTGHNSYLTGNQLSSDSSDVPIIKALERSVRVIELDIWPNSAKDDVVVLHGRTLTTPVPLIKCLESIKKHAFVASPYPVVITLEDHLTPDLQAKVAEMVTKVFGDMLYYPEAGCLEEFPSPEDLKHRILLSTKPPKEYLESKNKSRDGSSRGGKGDAADESESDTEDQDTDVNNQKSCQLAAPEYKRLIAIHAGKPKEGLRQALASGMDKVSRLSLSEHALEKAVSSFGADIARFTHRNILRIYPKGTRVTSSNYDPMIGWTHGAQMVAFNMQGYGKLLWMMHGMFRANGGCGYVKKPKFLTEKGPNGEVFDPDVKLPVMKTLKVNVYLGDGWRLDFSPTHFDTFSPPDFYTKVYILGVPADKAKYKTKIIEDDWAPVWEEEFTFPLTVPDLALLRIEVREHDMSDKDDFGGQTCLPLSELRQGIRSIPVYDKKGEKLKSVRLLMRFQFI